MELDHVLIAVADLDAAAREVEERYGLTSIEGGRHEGFGTANRIVPLGDTYLELIAVVDEAEAARSSVGDWVANAPRGRPLGWCLRTDQLDEVVRRLDLTIVAVSRTTPDGRLFRGRIAGSEQAAAEPSLPFFIERDESSPFPGHAAASHRSGLVQISRLELSGYADRLADWLGSHDLPITIRAGAPAVASIVLAGSAGEIVVDEL